MSRKSLGAILMSCVDKERNLGIQIGFPRAEFGGDGSQDIRRDADRWEIEEGELTEEDLGRERDGKRERISLLIGNRNGLSCKR
jgi:hypothetical protein